MNIEATRDTETGRFPSYAWPGGYTIIYVATDGGVFCGDCASGDNGSECRTEDGPDDCPGDGWKIDCCGTHDEGPPEECAHCGRLIWSSYGCVGPTVDSPNCYHCGNECGSEEIEKGECKFCGNGEEPSA